MQISSAAICVKFPCKAYSLAAVTFLEIGTVFQQIFSFILMNISLKGELWTFLKF